MEIEKGQVKVYIWSAGSKKEFLKQEETGHAALSVMSKSGTPAYLSWYPTKGLLLPSSARMPPGYGKKHTDLKSSPRYYSDKVLNEGIPSADTALNDIKTRSATCKAVFSNDSIDTEKVLKFIAQLMFGKSKTSGFAQAATYNLLFQNCSSTVSHALRAGYEINPNRKYDVTWPNHSFWTPFKVWIYTYLLVNSLSSNAKVTRCGSPSDFKDKSKNESKL